MLRIGLAVCATLVATPAFACSIPVFRFALEQWPPSAYQLAVVHKGPLSPDHRAEWEQLIAKAKRPNVRVADVDLGGDVEPIWKAVWDREGQDAALPRIVLRYPDSRPETPSLWSGPLTSPAIPTILDSPARRTIFERLTLGNAGVIVLLLSGDATADEAARAMLRRELPRVAARIELPARTADGPQIQSDLPLRLDFPVVEVARDGTEDLFVRLLVGSDDGLDRVRGPIAFPVFGRGRALCSLHGDGVAMPGELEKSLDYLCRACSCQVKELNPGLDLLIVGDWDFVFEAEVGPAPRIVAGSTPPVAETRPHSEGPGKSEPRSRPADGYQAVESDESPRRRPWFRYAALCLALVIVSSLWARRSRRPNPSESS